MDTLEFIISELHFHQEDKNFKQKIVGTFNLTIDQVRDSIKDEIDIAFDEMKKNAKGEFEMGIVVMPYIKAIYKKTDTTPES